MQITPEQAIKSFSSGGPWILQRTYPQAYSFTITRPGIAVCFNTCYRAVDNLEFARAYAEKLRLLGEVVEDRTQSSGNTLTSPVKL